MTDISTPASRRNNFFPDEREALAAAKAIRNARAAQKRAERIQRVIELSNQNAPLPEDRRYPVILADPPWAFEAYGKETGLDRSAEAHYPTMSTDSICAMPVADIATPDAVLFLWATAPHLLKAIEVMRAWGFEYRTGAVWDKEVMGMGYYFRVQHELLLVGKRGALPVPLPANRPRSVIRGGRREHSRKPDEVYGIIERMYPELPKIELFARQAREGWAMWGNEPEKFAAAVDRSIEEDRASWIREEIRTLEEKSSSASEAPAPLVPPVQPAATLPRDPISVSNLQGDVLVGLPSGSGGAP
jgi:N6-adenosine-specific RNA methylase IME4